MRKENKVDIAIISDKWLNVDVDKIYTYTPPIDHPAIRMAKTHATPISTWGKHDVFNTLSVEVDWDRAWKKYKILRKKLCKRCDQNRN